MPHCKEDLKQAGDQVFQCRVPRYSSQSSGGKLATNAKGEGL